MKKAQIILSVITLSILFFSQVNGQFYPSTIRYLDPYNPEYETGVVLVKMQEKTGIRTSNDFLASEAYQLITQNFPVEKTVHLFPRAQIPSLRTLSTYSGQTVELRDLAAIFKLKLGPGIDAKAAADSIAKFPDIEFAEPDYYHYSLETEPNDPLAAQQWYLDVFPGVNAKAAWDSTTGDTLQIIGVIDTGVDWDHPDLAQKIWNNWQEFNGIAGVDDDANGFVDDFRGWDWINEDNNPNDDNSHGTHVAGIAAAVSNNSIGIAGISWGAKIMPLKVLQSSGVGTSSDVALAAEYAYENGATIINMSLGSYAQSMTLKTVLENAYAYCALVAAAGNNSKAIEGLWAAPMFPACYSFVIGTEAYTQSGFKASFSNYDPSGPLTCGNSYGYNYEMRAPGVDIMSAFPNGNYDELSGTSMSAPILSGAIALMKTMDPDIQNTTLFAKLIYSANNGILDIYNALEYVLNTPDLHFVSFTLEDSLGNNDGHPDAGETVQIWLTVNNTAGLADSVQAVLRFSEFEDTTTAEILDSAAYIGYISTYASLNNQTNPFLVQISEDIANNRDIVLEYEVFPTNGPSITGNIIITCFNVVELGGFFNTDTTLTADFEYWVTNNFMVMPGCTLTLNPGVHIVIFPDVYFNPGIIISEGTPDSLIDFYGNNISINLSPGSTFSYTKFHDFTGDHIFEFFAYNPTFNNVIFENNSTSMTVAINSTFFTEVNYFNNSGMRIDMNNGGRFINSNIVNNISTYNAIYNSRFNCDFSNSCLFNNDPNSVSLYANLLMHYDNIFWGTTDSAQISNLEIWDFYDQGNLPIYMINPCLDHPPAECHGIVWKVEINGQNPQYAQLDPIGCETVKFEVYFNRAMDPENPPFLTFGVCEPFTQHIIEDSSSWSADSTIYTAYAAIGLETGDGINTVRVASARDLEHFEIPVEYTRFHFNIQAASSASLTFIATPGIGKVDLEWPEAPSPDLLGYNMYRFHNLTDTTFSDTVLLNQTLITDTLYTDFEVLPDCTYHYLYTVISTDMEESNYSNSAEATPFSAPTGDANGDLAVNVLDIISIVSYIIGGNPQPFLFDAADVNMDDMINVLDIVGVVNIIMGTTVQSAGAPLANAVITQYPDKAVLTIDGDICGLQYKISGDSLSQIEVKALPGWELATCQKSAAELMVYAYSFTNSKLPAGDYLLAEYAEGANLQISEGLAANPQGQGISAGTVLAQEGLVPTAFKLYQNYPNPFNPVTVIPYDIPVSSSVSLKIYNILGQEVNRWDLGTQPPGKYQVIWNGDNKRGIPISSGLYFVKMKAGDYSCTRKMMLLK